ncbi:MAG: phospholipase/carboxylesterase [Chlamydiales bacterium]|jgi:phospholipase/carboxylesterase
MNSEITPLLPCIEVEPKGDTRADASVIWLHGLGADGNDFVSIIPMLGLGPDRAVRFVFPNAPSIPVTVNGGMVMPAWYDVTGTDLQRQPDVDGVRRSAAQVARLIARENERGIPSARIVLAGFSQGGVIALYQGLRHGEPLAGIMALSTYLAGDEDLEQERSAANRSVSIFQAHGSLDPMVPFERGHSARERLTGLGYAVEWHEFAMEHQVCIEEIEAIGAWLQERLGVGA